MSVGVTQRLDRAQKDSVALSVAVPTVKKFSEDKSANLGPAPERRGEPDEDRPPRATQRAAGRRIQERKHVRDGVVRTAQYAFSSVWEIPGEHRPGLVKQVGRSILVLATIGLGLVLTTLLSGLISSSASGVNLGAVAKVGGYVLAAALDARIFVAARAAQPAR
jgi:hypothetical protein